MPALATFAQAQLDALEKRNLKRVLHPGERLGPVTILRDGRPLISFSCNNYLGLTHRGEVRAAATAAIAAAGTGAAASRLVTGSQKDHHALERALAAWKGYGAGRLFGSGYLANIGAIGALLGPGDLILLDKLAHACLLDGAKLSGARAYRFQHGDMADLRRLLETHRAHYRHCLIVTETVFSMDGDRAPLAEIAPLAESHDAWWMADDAHGLGEAVSPAPDLLSGTLSKALGSYGGYVLSNPATVEYLASSARAFMFSTALPPADVAAGHAALALLRAEPHLRERAWQNAVDFTERLGLPRAESQIVPLILGSAEAALAASAALQRAGFLVAAIRPPTVPAETARLRFSFSAMHEAPDIARLAEAVRALAIVRKNPA